MAEDLVSGALEPAGTLDLSNTELAVIGEAVAILTQVRDRHSSTRYARDAASLGCAVLLLLLDHVQHAGGV